MTSRIDRQECRWSTDWEGLKACRRRRWDGFAIIQFRQPFRDAIEGNAFQTQFPHHSAPSPSSHEAIHQKTRGKKQSDIARRHINYTWWNFYAWSQTNIRYLMTTAHPRTNVTTFTVAVPYATKEFPCSTERRMTARIAQLKPWASLKMLFNNSTEQRKQENLLSKQIFNSSTRLTLAR